MGITREQAYDLGKYRFKLIDKEGNTFEICGVFEDEVYSKISNGLLAIKYNQLGTEYFVLCRPISSLTETIEHEGRKVVPMVEFAAMAGLTPFTGKKRMEYDEDRKAAFIECKHLEHYGIKQRFAYFENYGFRATLDGYKAYNQEALFNKLYEFNFPLSGLDESQIKYF